MLRYSYNFLKRNIAIQEIGKAGNDFAALRAKEDVQKAFAAYCDDIAHIRSPDTSVSGKKQITSYSGQSFFTHVSLNWSPDFIDAGESGDIGYKYGCYMFAFTDSTGKKEESKCIFYSVWRSKNGVWKSVWDS